MFSGIIEYLGAVRKIEPLGRGRRLTIEAGPVSEGVRPGDSVAVNGVCLTATSVEGSLLVFEAVSETLSRTNLGELSRDRRVNLERSLTADSRVHGHWVLGHVDSTTRVAGVEKLPESVLMSFELNEEIAPGLVKRGSVAVDGISLTIARLDDRVFTCSLIGFTLSHTTLGEYERGDRVNIETDIIGKYVLKALAGRGGEEKGLDREKLEQWGY